MVKEPAYPNIHQDLIDQCREGNREAQFRIYGLYYKSMYNASLRIVRDPGEAEDIMQESFLSAFEKIGTYGGTVSFGAWLKKIVVNRSLDSIKKKRMYFEVLDEQISDDLKEGDVTGEVSMDIDKVRDSIMKLPDVTTLFD